MMNTISYPAQINNCDVLIQMYFKTFGVLKKKKIQGFGDRQLRVEKTTDSQGLDTNLRPNFLQTLPGSFRVPKDDF